MFDLQDDASRREKCYTSVANLSAFVDPKHPPTKKAPFSTIWGHPFVHTVEVLLPERVYKTIQSSVETKLPKLRYARVFMSLSALLEGDFFNTYVKTGNILMISEGRSGSDNVFTLKDGVLKLELSKEIYERTGLTGKPIRSGGRKHAKERFIVEINLRLPSMLHGKKGFERIAWAFKNVLTHTVAWLFYDLASGSNGISDADTSLKGNHPHILESDPVRTDYRDILVPPFALWESTPEQELRDNCDEISEWLAMVSLGSPRVSSTDDIDPYLSRYSVPDASEAKPADIVSLKWRGLIPPKWVMGLFYHLLRETGKSSESSWFGISAGALGKEAVEGKDGYMVMVLPSDGAEGDADKSSQSAVCWEFVGASVI
ncbi:ribonuclease P 40kDa subunit-domain-containing protein [Aspergillus avenaceus]|uniref:Ribonuclease P 40kDa subunit-domain-containing protein n=1 Tax=Aspergillus avenaceus TaxID=36643 RepID=A0A5N6U0J6_ASPAV|nr:ribonuclease P 40kDa subunit-domain-containing protein [Aspergillus avenaceus]